VIAENEFMSGQIRHTCTLFYFETLPVILKLTVTTIYVATINA